MSVHGIYNLKLETEDGDEVLRTTLRLHPNQDLDGNFEDIDKDIAYICGSCTSSFCYINHAIELGLLGSEANSEEYKLKLYYPIIVDLKNETLSFNIYFTEKMDHSVFNKPVVFKAEDRLKTGKVEADVEIKSKKCRVLVQREEPKYCQCKSRKLSRTHCIESAIHPVNLPARELL